MNDWYINNFSTVIKYLCSKYNVLIISLYRIIFIRAQNYYCSFNQFFGRGKIFY